jgi:hypothetical protein
MSLKAIECKAGLLKNCRPSQQVDYKPDTERIYEFANVSERSFESGDKVL